MKKLFVLFLIVLSVCSCVFGVGCISPENHEHDYNNLLERIEPSCSATGKEVYSCSCGQEKNEEHNFSQSGFTCLTCENPVYTLKFKLKANDSAPNFTISSQEVQRLGLTDLGNDVYQLKVLAGENVNLPVAVAQYSDEYYNLAWAYGGKRYSAVAVDQSIIPALLSTGTIEFVLEYSSSWTPFF